MADGERATKRRRTTNRESGEDGDAASVPVFKTLRSGRRIGVKSKRVPESRPGGPTFHKFKALPVELRVYIWQLAAEDAMHPYHPLRVRIYKGFEQIRSGESSNGRKRKAVLRLAAMPDLPRTTRARRSLLQACREAHNEVRRLWNSSVSLHRGRTLYFSHTYDIIYIDIHEQAIFTDLFRLKRAGDLPSFTANIGHVAFDMVPNYPLWMAGRDDMNPHINLLFCFPRLHSVSLVHYNAFSPEIKWHLKKDVRWLLRRSTQHGINFRSFPALEGFDYSQKCAVGNRQSAPYIRHECAICTIHKCACMLSLLRNKPAGHMQPQTLAPEQVKFLARLRRFMLLAATPSMGDLVPAYRDRCSGWWNQRSVLSGSRPDDSVFADDSDDNDDTGATALPFDDDEDVSSEDEEDLAMDAFGAGWNPVDLSDGDGNDGLGDFDDDDAVDNNAGVGTVDFDFDGYMSSDMDDAGEGDNVAI